MTYAKKSAWENGYTEGNFTGFFPPLQEDVKPDSYKLIQEVSSRLSLLFREVWKQRWREQFHRSVSSKTKDLTTQTLHDHSWEIEGSESYIDGLFIYLTFKIISPCCDSVAKLFDSLRPHELQHARLPSPPLFPGVCSDSGPLSSSNCLILCCSLVLLPSVFPSIRDFSMSRLLTSDGQNIGALASVLPMNEYSGLISFQFSSVQLLSHVRLFATPWIAACQDSLSITNSWVHSGSWPSSQWCHPAISSSVISFSSCPQSLPASESFPMSQLFAWGGQSTGVSALASFLPKESQGWFL